MVLASSSHEVSSYTVSCSSTLQQASTTREKLRIKFDFFFLFFYRIRTFPLCVLCVRLQSRAREVKFNEFLIKNFYPLAYISSTMTIASPRFVSSTSTVTCSKTIPQPIITEVYAQMHLRLHCKLFQCHIQEFKRGLSNLILRVQSTDYCDQSSIIFNRSNVHC